MADYVQDQFLTVLDRDEAERRFRAHLDLSPLEPEDVPLGQALGRVLAADVVSPVDVPGFDRSNVDGYAVRAEETFGAAETAPVSLRLNPDQLTPGVVPHRSVEPGTATAIATGGMLPRGATAVVMVEFTDVKDGSLVISRPVVPGANVTFAGTDVGRGETILAKGTVLTSRDTGVLAAVGIATVSVVRKPRVAILSTGDELRQPGDDLPSGCVFDSNATVLADAVREIGCEPCPLGIVPDDEHALTPFLDVALCCDAVLLSGGTSKGQGDISYRVVANLGTPGIVAHGVALKPGKPLCLAVIGEPLYRRDKVAWGIGPDGNRFPPNPYFGIPEPGLRRPVPVVVLPGFPTSAVFTFHEFVAPVLRAMAGRPAEKRPTASATLPRRVNSERGRTEYLLVGLVDTGTGWSAVPMGKGSGSVTAFARADGFVTIPRHREYLEAGEEVDVTLLAVEVRPADLVIVGSHCVGLDVILARLREEGVTAKTLAVGSTAGLEAAKRGECDVAGIHLLDPKTDAYNRPFLTPDLELIPGYGRVQGIVYRKGDGRFEGKSVEEAVTAAKTDPACVLANRNRGSGTRVLIDQLLNGATPAGYLSEAKTHAAVAAAVTQGRADWGVAIEPVANANGLGFLPVRAEEYDFVVPKSRRDRPAVRAFVEILTAPEVVEALRGMGFVVGT
jgi:putative molybdopterin biosynthesis protein